MSATNGLRTKSTKKKKEEDLATLERVRGALTIKNKQ
jgi:hypothetical protein